MLDQFGRNIDYVRISLTEACNLQCQYCRPQRQLTPNLDNLLTYEELLRLVDILVDLGINKFKITGGEPLVRQGCLTFLEQLRGKAQQLTITTNGTLLASNAERLAAMGIDCINVSLDSCVAKRYEEITGRDVLEKVLSAIRTARALDLPLKLNCVPLKPFRALDLQEMLKLAEAESIPLRFIELMPLSCNQDLESLNGAELRKLLQELGYELKAAKLELGNGPAAYYEAANLSIPIGFIEPIHGKFCASCNRLRITAAGFVKPCLYSSQGLDIKALLRNGADAKEISRAFKELLLQKPKEHAFEKVPAGFSMNSIGG